jgi:hypothetical protein
MDKLYANLDKLVSIKISYEKLTEYEFYPEQPEEVKYTWGVFKKIVKPWRPARWAKPTSGWDYYSDTEIRDYDYYRIDDRLKKVFRKPRTEIRFINGDSHIKYFNTNEELDLYLANIKAKSTVNLHIISE